MNPRSRVEEHYDANAEREWERLDRHRTEFAVTLRAFADFLPQAPATVAATVHANALDLSRFPAGSFDAVLLMGPMYHLLTRGERLQAASEAVRILRPGGRMFTAFVSRFAPFRWAARHDPGWFTRGEAYARQVLETGVHDQGAGFPNAYFAHPAEISPTLEHCGLKTLAVIGCEGAVSMNEEGVNSLTGPEWDAWVDLNYAIGRDPFSLGAAEHILHVGEKPAC